MVLKRKKIKINKKITQINLEEDYWECLAEIAKLEESKVSDIIDIALRTSDKNIDIESAIKTFVYKYYKLIAFNLPAEQVNEYRKKLKSHLGTTRH